jgi:hypothetical protein
MLLLHTHIHTQMSAVPTTLFAVCRTSKFIFSTLAFFTAAAPSYWTVSSSHTKAPGSNERLMHRVTCV